MNFSAWPSHLDRYDKEIIFVCYNGLLGENYFNNVNCGPIYGHKDHKHDHKIPQPQ